MFIDPSGLTFIIESTANTSKTKYDELWSLFQKWQGLTDDKLTLSLEGEVGSGKLKVLVAGMATDITKPGTGVVRAMIDSSNIYCNPDDNVVLTVWDEATTNRIADLHPDIRAAATGLILVAQLNDIKLRITSGYRSIEEQNELYAIGRTKPGNKVTNAKGGQSYHNFGLAFDVVEIKDGVALWDNDWGKIGNMGKLVGFEWGGNWTKFVDLPHFQMTFDYSESTLLKKYNNGQLKNGYVEIP